LIVQIAVEKLGTIFGWAKGAHVLHLMKFRLAIILDLEDLYVFYVPLVLKQ